MPVLFCRELIDSQNIPSRIRLSDRHDLDSMKRKHIIALATLGACLALFLAFGFLSSWLARRKELRANQLPDIAFQAISSGSRLTLYSLDPEAIQPSDPSAGFHGFRVLGKTIVSDPSLRNRLSISLRQGLDSWRHTYGSCFMPRHGLRALLSERNYDLVICFACREVRYYSPDGTESGYLGLGDATDSKPFAEIIDAANLPKAQPD